MIKSVQKIPKDCEKKKKISNKVQCKNFLQEKED